MPPRVLQKLAEMGKSVVSVLGKCVQEEEKFKAILVHNESKAILSWVRSVSSEKAKVSFEFSKLKENAGVEPDSVELP